MFRQMTSEAKEHLGTKTLLDLAKWCGGQAKTSGRIVLPNGSSIYPGDWIFKDQFGNFYRADLET